MNHVLLRLVPLVVAAACAPASHPPGTVHDAPRTWTDERREGPLKEPVPPPLRSTGTYPDEDVLAPMHFLPESRWSLVGRGEAASRALRGRGDAFSAGVELMPPELPLRAMVWPHPAFPLAAAADSVVFATAWLPVARMNGEVQCDRAAGPPPVVRLVALYRVSGRDLGILAWIESRPEGCQVRAGGRDRLQAFLDDLDLYARGVVRRAVPIPIPSR